MIRKWGCLPLKKVFFLSIILVACGISLISLKNHRGEDNSLNFEAFENDFAEEKVFTAAPLFSTIGEFVYLPKTTRPCSLKSPEVLVIVPSSSGHVAHRSAIRQTWGKSDRQLNISIRTVFIVGQSISQKVNQRVLQEAKVHGDLVLVKLVDVYRNMTLKHLAGLNWVLSNCPKVPYVLKVDDDAFVDMKQVIDKLELFLGARSASGDALICQTVPEGSSAKRSGKWGITENEYHLRKYPEYCSGLSYFTRMATVAKMYDAAMLGNLPFLWIDDVFVTGLAAGFAKIKRVDIGVWVAENELQIVDWLKKGVGICPWMVAELSIGQWPSNAFMLWNKTKRAWMRKDSTIIFKA